MALDPGARLGPYEVLALLGAGGMGEVYRGRDTRLGRDVALKVISPTLAGNESFRHRFEREARAASALNHPSIVTVYDVGDTDGVSWIAMEWVDGRTLRQVLGGGALPVSEAWSITRQIADGLAAAHARGVIHRDLKPENIMVASDGRIRILDFGLARQHLPGGFEHSMATAETMAAVGATVDGLIVGTVGYMSPEQASGGTVDFRSDQFALGLLGYEMLAGQRAFGQGSAIETLWATIREEPVPLASIRNDIPEALDRVISRCLSKKPPDRFASTNDLLIALEPSLTGRVAVPPAAPWLRRSGATAAAAVGVVLVLALAAFIWNAFVSPPAPINSLAILPFENRSTGVESNYLGDELTESLISQLSRVPSLKVIARATVFRFRGTQDALKAGRQLGVGAVLVGSVARRGQELVISAELVDVATGDRLWGDTYNRPFAELLRVQDTIAAAISDKLRLRLSGEEKRVLGGQGTDSPEAYELFLRARHLLTSDSEEDDLEAQRLYLQAIEKDPLYVDAYLGSAAIYIRSAGNGFAAPKDAWALADRQIEKVRTLDPKHIGLRVFAASRQFMYAWDWAGAEREFLGLSDDPGVLQGNRYHPISMFFWARGWPDRAVTLLERALRVDPGNLESRVMLADFLAYAGRLDDAIAYYQAIIDVAPKDPRPLFGLAELLKRKRDVAGAIATLRKAYELDDDESGAVALTGARTEQDYDQAQLMIARLAPADLEARAKERYISPLDLARAHARAGHREQAIKYLELALLERAPMVVLLKVDPAWDSIRDDPRFAAMVRRVGIP